jgi:CRISPR-associated protein Cas5d
MHNTHPNTIEFRTWGQYAMFTDPITRVGGEKCSYHIPTYEALKGIVKSIYWKPTLIWIVDEVRVLRRIQTQTKGTKPLRFGGGNDLSIYTFLADVEYQVRAHFEWNEYRPEFTDDRNDAKHMDIARRSLDKGGRQDIFFGTRDCQGYVEPVDFGRGIGEYDNAGSLAYGLMFHGFDYPDESGLPLLRGRFWSPTMLNGVVQFIRPNECTVVKDIREMNRKTFAKKATDEPDTPVENEA